MEIETEFDWQQMEGWSPEEVEWYAMGPFDGGIPGTVRRVRRVLDRIAQSACEPRFTIKTVAAELGVSVRTVQILLGETGSTFSEHVAEHRLRRAWRLLANPGSRLAIAEVAYAAGYNDLANSHCVFRRRFGETPAGVRSLGAAPH